MFFRECALCKVYMFDSKGIVKNSLGKPVKRGLTQKPNCNICRKYNDEDGEIWEKFTPKNIYYFKTFLIAKHFHALPAPGGIDQQSPETMERLLLLNEVFEGHSMIENRASQANFLSGLVGVTHGR